MMEYHGSSPKFAWFRDYGQTVPVRSLHCLPHANEPVRLLLKRPPQLGYSSRSPCEFVEVRSGLGIALPSPPSSPASSQSSRRGLCPSRSEGGAREVWGC
jgi:hypothetical protein